MKESVVKPARAPSPTPLQSCHLAIWNRKINQADSWPFGGSRDISRLTFDN